MSVMNSLSRRERQIMDILFELETASVQDVLERLEDPPSYSAVRAMLRILEEKGHVTHRQTGPRYVYEPTESREAASRSALKHLLHTFFDGSMEKTVATLLDIQDGQMSDEEVKHLMRLIEQAHREGR